MKNIKRIFAAVIAVCLVLCMTSCDISGIISDITGADTVVIEGENVKVDDKMMGFFLNDHIINWYNNYGAYVGLFSIDLSKDLRDQTYGDTGKGSAYETFFLGSYDGTWYDYFLDETKRQVEAYVVYADAAAESGITLTEDQLIEIESIIAGLEEDMSEADASYTDWYGSGVDEDTVRRCYELMFLASNFHDYFWDKLDNELSSNKAIEYRENNRCDFYSVDCYVFEIELVSDGLDDYEFDARWSKISGAAEAMSSAESPEDFLALVENYGTNIGLGNFSLELESLPFSKEGGLINDWLFGNSPAEKNEGKSIQTSEQGQAGTKAYEKRVIKVYYVVEPLHYDTELTHNFAYFVSSNRNDVYDLIGELSHIVHPDLDIFLNTCEFIQLENYGEGYEFGDGEMFEFGKAEEVDADYFATQYHVLNEWVESSAREDRTFSDIIEIEIENASDKENHYAVIYFYSHGEAVWEVEAFAGAMQLAHDEWYNDRLVSCPIMYNTSALSRLDTVKLSDGKATDDNFFSNILNWLDLDEIIEWIFGESSTESTDNGSYNDKFDNDSNNGSMNGSFGTIIGGGSSGDVIIGDFNGSFGTVEGGDATIVLKPGVSIEGSFNVIVTPIVPEDGVADITEEEDEGLVRYPSVPGKD